MGTHPIFESDFDCLTEREMSLARAYRGFLPLANRVLVKRAETVTKTAGGIMLPETAQAKLNVGEIVAHGEGYVDEKGKLHPLAVELGQKVLMPEFGGTEVTIGGEKLQLYRDQDFLGVLES